MTRALSTFVVLTCAVAVLTTVVQPVAYAGRWEVRQEIREGAREVRREKREAYRELKRCETRQCARREVREGYREVEREKREARREIRRELRDYDDDRYDRRGDVLKGVAIGAAVVGIATAVSRAAQDDD